jgi:uncharacterized membrane protein
LLFSAAVLSAGLMASVPGVAAAQAGPLASETRPSGDNWIVDQFDAAIAVQADGSVRLEERISVDFAALAKHGIYRDLPVVYWDEGGAKTYTELTDIVVQQDGSEAQVQVTRNEANLRIRVGSPNTTVSGRHEYLVAYTARGVLQSWQDFDELYWNVTGNDWEAPIASVSATVTVPANIVQSTCYVGARGATGQCETAEREQRELNFAARSLAPGEGMTVAVGFMTGVVPIVTIAPPPSPADVVLAPIALGTAALVFVVGLAIVFSLWWRYGRDRWWQRSQLPGERSDREGLALPEKILPLFRHQPVSVEYEPPDKLRPAEIGVLVDERADTLDVSATIVDLASRGYLLIEELEKKWLLGKTDYELVRTDRAAGKKLADYERELLARLFNDGTAVKLSSLKNTFYKDLRKVKELLYREVVAKKLFAGRPDRVRLRYLGLAIADELLGVALLVLALFLFSRAGAVVWYHAALAGLGVGEMAAATAMFALAPFMPRKTGYGRELYQRSQGYQLFVSGTEKYRAKFYEDEGLFVAVLPYAIMFGVTDKLAKAFAEMDIKPPQPVWYHGAAAFSAVQFSASLNSFSQSLSTAMASAPSSSGSGGGGSSGGGFGGGGGGSW